MFDARTAELMRLAPSMPGLDADDLPKALTRHYARLVSSRLAGGAEQPGEEDAWPIDRIADVYEIVASLEVKPDLRRAAAFVAGTAQQIIARRPRAMGAPRASQLIDRDGVDASVAASLLFLAAEQYADANEAGGAIVIPLAGLQEARELGRHVRDLVRGNLGAILERRDGRDARRGAAPKEGSLQKSALRAMLSALGHGVEQLAAHLLAGAEEEAHLPAAMAAFEQVLALSSQVGALPLMPAGKGEGEEAPLVTRYPGPAHLASLLLLAAGGIAGAALTRLPAPGGADGDFWERWLRFRAKQTPYVWRNHREAIGREFHLPGKSAVLVLPTGAGKTTVSVLKIAGTLARGKKVVFLAPTHALVDQLTDDLQALFPADQFPLQVSGDFDSLLLAAPDPFDPLMVHRPSRMAKQRRHPAIAIATILLCQCDDVLRQRLFVICPTRHLALRRSMLTQHPAYPSLGYRKRSSHMINAASPPRGAQKFPRAASCNISLSSVRSEIARRSRRFSFSRFFIRRA